VKTHELLAVAVGAAQDAGELLAEYFESPARGVRTKTSVRDLVSEADLAAEKLLRDRLLAARPRMVSSARNTAKAAEAPD
jgi:myo-inositol-1(or 4)-monophosphatase